MSKFSGPIGIEVDNDVFLTPISPTFGLVDENFIRRVFRERARLLASLLSGLISDLEAGHIQNRAFVRQSMRALQQAYYTIFSLGALSVDQFHVLTDRDLEVLNSELLGQRRFLQGFARDIRGGVLDMAPESRARLYLAALRGVFELGRIEALPAGPYDWILGDTDHCVACLQASLGGPYKRSSMVAMNLPVVPGIPGSGDICQGLTRCGCTLKLKGIGRDTTLQLQMRDILAATVLEV